MQPTSIGIIGCGNISGIYLENLGKKFPGVRVRGCADLDLERARKRAETVPGARAMRVAELLADPEIGLVVNLTIPGAHYAVACQAIDAGKHVYSEKPLTTTRDEGAALLARAKARGVRVGNAPDTFLGGAFQTCRKLMDDGAIGAPVACTAFMMSRGHEHWHPDPEFYYKPGGGPLFDMGPYYLTALVSLLGPVKRVASCTRMTFPERVISSEPKKGTRIRVEVPTHVAGTLEFVNGAIGTLIMTFDLRGGSNLRNIEVHGTEGTLNVPDPNGFGGPVEIRKAGESDWSPAPPTHGYLENWRGVGPADMAAAIRTGRPHRASGELAFHVLDIMSALHESSDRGHHIVLTSSCARPAPLPVRLADGQLD
ncbi:MAG: Gfo/Idh/MocA family oxidoreductase [Lentisphaerae bacterium]|nr:Gfo/Idh/MocA family oxidoreductase [Lentisphaerota bacterium]